MGGPVNTLVDMDKRQYNVELGARLKKARLDAGMTMQAAVNELTRREGSTDEPYPSRIGNYEHGRNMPDAYTLSLLIEIYDCDPAWLHCGVQANQLAKIVEIYHQTDERGRKSIFGNASAQPVQDPRPAKRKKRA